MHVSWILLEKNRASVKINRSVAPHHFRERDANVCKATLIDLDANATTPIDPRVLEAMSPHLLAGGNPESRHSLGRSARRAWDDAREKVAALLGAHADELTFTSGGTEANNAALTGLLRPLMEKRRRQEPDAALPEVLVSSIEHPAVGELLKYLEKKGEIRLSIMPVTSDGTAEKQAWISAFAQDSPPALAALMLANNETGAIQPVAELAEIAARRGILFHTDAVQAVGRVDVNFHELGVTTLAAGSHKMHGPPGIGIMLVKRGYRLEPIMQGGGQQRGVRPGTPAVGLAVGLAKAMELWHCEKAERTARWQALQKQFLGELQQNLASSPISIVSNTPTDPARQLPQTLNLWLDHPRIQGDLLLMQLDLAGLAVSLGSACASGSTRPSPVLLAMGFGETRARSSIRISFSSKTTADEVSQAAHILADIAMKLVVDTDEVPEIVIASSPKRSKDKPSPV